MSVLDIKDCLEFGKIYTRSYTFNRSLVNVLPALYYTNSSQRSFFNSAQRKIFAEKGIQHVKQAMNGPNTPMVIAWLYQGMVLAYSQLTILAESKKEQDNYPSSNSQKIQDLVC